MLDWKNSTAIIEEKKLLRLYTLANYNVANMSAQNG